MRYFLIFFLLCCSVVGQEHEPSINDNLAKEIEFCSEWFVRLKEEGFYKEWGNCTIAKMSEKEKQFFILYQEGRLESRLRKVERYIGYKFRGAEAETMCSIHNMRVLLAADREVLILDLMLEHPHLLKDLQFYAAQVTHYNETNQLNEMSVLRPAMP